MILHGLSTENLTSNSLCRACIKHRAPIRRREPSYYIVEREREREREREKSEGEGKTLQIPREQMATFLAFRSLRSQLEKSFRVVGDSAACPRHHRAETPAKLIITTEPARFAFSVRKHENPQTNKETSNPNSLNPNPNSAET
jgi:hypothetical protein